MRENPGSTELRPLGHPPPRSGALGTVFLQSCLGRYQRRRWSQKPGRGNTKGQREALGEATAACGLVPGALLWEERV